jgi:hypothetical protein
MSAVPTVDIRSSSRADTKVQKMRGRARRAIQRIAMTKLMTLFAMLALAGCPKGDKNKEAPAPIAKTTEPAPAALPADCNDYKAAIDKLASCDKLAAETRDGLKKAYETTSAAWSSLTPEAKAGLGTSCKTALDAVNAAAKTTCGW